MGNSSGGAIAYDGLFCRGGAEHLTLALARGLAGTDVVVGGRNAAAFPAQCLADLRCLELGWAPPVTQRALRTLTGLYRFRYRAQWLARYDWVVFSGANAPQGVWHRSQGGNIYYCHTLPRFAFDLYDDYIAAIPRWQRPLFRALVAQVRRYYAAAIARMDAIVANSSNVRGRLEHYLGLSAQVVHPPCDTDGYQWLADEGFFLSTARLEPFKRVERLIEAFRSLPEHELVVASGGSQEQQLRRLAANCPNIHFTGWLSAEALQSLTGRARATLYVAQDEDFGMSPVESMAAGKPVIGVAEGGLIETVLEGQTGILLSEPDPKAIAETVRGMTQARAATMRPACEARASHFATGRFVKAMAEVIDSVRGERAGSTCLQDLLS
ncbi:glycosyltransferase [Vreelandella utahensis]|uniref:glycosyltransferase n=1 Tax=Vreelandella halophila TaxID=86177 RepID=UPI001C4DFFC5|nr:glycosyltransferase [Halomonas utahensis]